MTYSTVITDYTQTTRKLNLFWRRTSHSRG